MKKERTQEEILAAMRRWLKRIPNPDERIYSIPANGRHLTFSEVMAEIEKNTELGRKWLEQLKNMARRHNQDIVEFIDRIKT